MDFSSKHTPPNDDDDALHNNQISDREIVAAWYKMTWRGVTKRLTPKGIKITNRVFMESDYAAVFYGADIPTTLPSHLCDWAAALKEQYKQSLDDSSS